MTKHAMVLMSTYNGQTYLREQLQCIFDQTFKGKITVYVRDDGSHDDTVAIINDFPQTENRVIRLVEGENLGPQRSFLELIRTAEDADFYFFADQDDVWDLDKIEVAAKLLAQQEDKPAVYCCNYRLSDMELSVYENAVLKQAPKFSPLSILFYNKIPGCAMATNRALMQQLQKLPIENVMMHDSMVLCYGALVGRVLFDSQPRITHRIHLSNVVGDGHKKIVLHKWIPEKLRLLVKKEKYDMAQIAQAFLETGGEQIKSRYRNDLYLLRDFKLSFGNTLRLLRHKDCKGPMFDRTVMSIRCKILFHIF